MASALQILTFLSVASLALLLGLLDAFYGGPLLGGCDATTQAHGNSHPRPKDSYDTQGQ